MEPRTGPHPRVAVVVVNLDGGALLARCLDAVARQTLAPARVLVVDNGSTDGSAEGLEARWDVEVLRPGRNVGFAAANNLAVRHVDDCEWVALLNPDAFPEPLWLEALLRAAGSHGDFSFFASRLLNAADPAELDGAGDALHPSGFAWRRGHGAPAGSADEPREVFSPCAAAALYRRDEFLAAGGFDEDYFCYSEDTDLAFRLRLVGRRCLYVPDAVVHHVGSAIAGRESAFTVFHLQRNLVWTYVKGMPFPLVWTHLPQLVAVSGLMTGWYATRGQGRAAARGLGAALLGLPAVLRKRRAVQAARRVPVRAIARELSPGAAAYRAVSSRVRRASTAHSTSAARVAAEPGKL